MNIILPPPLLVTCVKLDSYVSKIDAPTFIKMDIEGGEVNCILGAKDVIRKYKPKLAISVYHKWTDLFEIINMIHTYNPNYKFYMKNTDRYGECILFAKN